MASTEHSRIENRLQVAALCWRRHPALEVLLVTSLRTRRLILPKGWPHTGMSLADSAAREALEEAGVAGAVEQTALGSYYYLKEKGGHSIGCDVQVFALHVTEEKRSWPEKGAREKLWLPVTQAAQRVSELGLRALLLEFRRKLRTAA